MKTFSCADLKTVDRLWSDATQGKQGFTVQQNFLKALGNYKKMYTQVGWEDAAGRPLIEWNYNGQTSRMEYVPGKEPNYRNPPPGHLPTVEREYNFEVSINEALNRCGI